MSHAATHWLATVPPKDMTHGEFRVLFHLCDCHNPSMGCFPKQIYLREHTGLSNGGLNKALSQLEEKGLIQRMQERDEQTNRQKPTQYVLGFEIKKQVVPSPLSGGGAVSTSDTVPSPLSEGSRLHHGGDVYKDKPVREPVKEPCGPEADPQTIDVPSNFFNQFFTAFPRHGNIEKTKAALRDVIAAGADPSTILAGAKAYAAEQKGNNTRYIAYSENWVTQGRWVQIEEHAPPSRDDKLTAIAERIRKGIPGICLHIPPSTARELIAAGLITEEECKVARVLF